VSDDPGPFPYRRRLSLVPEAVVRSIASWFLSLTVLAQDPPPAPAAEPPWSRAAADGKR
jgi:hypothetical protein